MASPESDQQHSMVLSELQGARAALQQQLEFSKKLLQDEPADGGRSTSTTPASSSTSNVEAIASKGLMERKSLFEKDKREQRSKSPPQPSQLSPAAEVPAPTNDKPALSLKERMALLQGGEAPESSNSTVVASAGGAGGAGGPQKESPSAASKPSSLQDRMAAFSQSSQSNSSSELNKGSAKDLVPRAVSERAQPTAEAPKAEPPTAAGGVKSLAERRAAFATGAGSETEKEPVAPLTNQPSGKSLAERTAAFGKAASSVESSGQKQQSKPERAKSNIADKMSAFGGAGAHKDSSHPTESVPPPIPEPAKAGGLAQRAALFGGGGSSAKETSPDVERPQPSKPDASVKPVSLAERKAAFGGGNVKEKSPDAESNQSQAKSEATVKPGSLADRKAAFGGAGAKESSPEPKESSTGKVETPMPSTLAERMSAFGGGASGLKEKIPEAEPSKVAPITMADSATGSKPGKLSDKLSAFGGGRSFKENKEREKSPPIEPAPGTGLERSKTTGGISATEQTASQVRPMSLAERKAAFGGDATRPNESDAKKEEAAPVSVPVKSLAERKAAFGQGESPPKGSDDISVHQKRASEAIGMPQKSSSFKEQRDQRSSLPSFAGKHLTHQAREVASFLGGAPDAESDEEDTKNAQEAEAASVMDRASMFTSGGMQAGWDTKKERRPSPGKLGHVKQKEEKVDNTSLDVSDIKSRWKEGNVKKEDTNTNKFAEEAMFRCHTAASRTGGVAEMQSKWQDVADGKSKNPDFTPPKQSTKIQEIAEQIHFDPNTMMPGAQHPSLNYNVTETSLRANEWRDFNSSMGHVRKTIWDDDDDELPPPGGGIQARSSDAIASDMQQLKNRANIPIEERLGGF